MAEENDNSQEKTEEATPRRLEKAREEGQTARSRELATMAVLLAGAGDDLDDDLRARVAHATGEPGIVRDRVSIGLHHDGIFTRVSPGASGGAVLGLSNGVWEF